ncbi:MAG: class I SAM-dependent methyltransferase, partial [Ilumatobacteraceae bacterium]
PHSGNARGPQEIDGFADEASEDFVSFHRTLAESGVADRVRHVRAPSDAAHSHVDGSIEVLYVDGAHRYAPARADVRDWGRRVVPSGTLLVHDSFSSVGVTMALVRELFFSNRFRYVGRSRSLAEYRADLAPGWRARSANVLRQIAQLPWFVRNMTIKVLIVLRMAPLLRAMTGRTPEWPY